MAVKLIKENFQHANKNLRSHAAKINSIDI